ncbi:hypothetical protein C1646_712387 [Rhizophagus diaphanus]|nr:hypothetical protein C1646_712387 [Rhizophagus diaphanus] [Rhizophagus sp. MUCL 43196]
MSYRVKKIIFATVSYDLEVSLNRMHLSHLDIIIAILFSSTKISSYILDDNSKKLSFL